MGRLREIGMSILGWVLLLTGLAAIVLPGPGLLLILAGLIVLSHEHEWARRQVEPIRRQAFRVARASVDSVAQIMFSVLGALALTALGMFWWADPTILTFWVVGPHLPAGGWGTGLGLIVSGLVALGLVVYSFVNFRLRDNGLPVS